jgi:hypothetical protein
VGNYLWYLGQPWLLGASVAVLAAAVVLTWLARRRLPGAAQRVGLFGLVLAVGAILVATVFREPWTTFCPACLGTWALDGLRAGQFTTQVVLNVALFVPAAFLATLLWPHPLRVTGLAVLLSLAIETTQALAGVGANDVLDVLANSAGALLGAWLGWVVNLARGRTSSRRAGALGAAAVLAAAVAVGWGGSVWVAESRQAAAIEGLQAALGGTTLADFERWEAADTLTAEVYRKGPAWPDGDHRSDTAATVRFPASFFFARRCVLATWTAGGFSAVDVAGAGCDGQLTG